MSPLILLVVMSWPAEAYAQQTQGTPPRRFDAEVGYLSFSWVARPSQSFAIGPEIGAGFLKQKVFAPSDDDLTGLVHTGIISTVRVTNAVDAEVGLRAGVGEPNSVACAGCSFSGYTGLTLGLFVGSRRLRFGTRALIGRTEGQALRSWSPLALRFQF